MNKYLTLTLILLIIAATAFSMGCAESNNEETSEDIIDADEETVLGENNVQGEIIFDEPVQSFSNTAIYLKLEDVSLQDIESSIITEDSIEGTSLDANNIQPIQYIIYYPKLDDRLTYSLSVHVDVDGNGRLSNGDYYSTWNNPVPTESGAHELDIHVEMI
jgi:uncharacterized lipoprotein YbaY